MTRAVVFKTKGKLDLRAITTFGLNAKPESQNPIGYFGTGLKYAIAVLAREKIPCTFWIDSKRWDIRVEDTIFRDKRFSEIFIVHQRSWPIADRKIKLPFTTELGKNWGLWQVFRELHANTLDEGGTTFATHSFQDGEREVEGPKGETWIVIESDKFVEEYRDRNRTFLKDGLTERTSDDSIQVFEAPSKSVYYRGIRIFDFPKEETSALTYNILARIELTEDRTAKNEWEIRHIIERYITQNAPKEQVAKAITAKGYERNLYFYGDAPSPSFLDAAKSAGGNLTYGARRLLDEIKEKEQTKKMAPQADLQKGLEVALAMLIRYEPKDSRAVSGRFVALAALATGDNSFEVMKVIDHALEVLDAADKARELKEDDQIRENPEHFPEGHPDGTGKGPEEEIPF